ncbi:LppA family lipoprotein [Nocardia farcinica]|uniref:LppA family lipoprotein n=1 Tax=Nocardia farcinica TaxID=37329 RepID=UPI001894D3DF|nr:LppA family lipoprotein [Nocardia farcinica]MBF6267611.1 hypothetical protein [Nocardia farcinica]MCZ9327089.1 LppA family lipoprotein [Nocardia farcinica]
MPGRLRRALAVAVVVAAVPGCATLFGDPPPPPSPEQIARAADEVAALPRAAEAEQSLRTAVEHIAAAAAAHNPALRWSWSGERAEGPCHGPYASVGGLRVVLPRYLAEGSIPASAWPEFRRVAHEIAAAAGAVDLRPDTSTPPHYHLDADGTDGAYWDNQTNLAVFAGPDSMTITANTGCRRP